MVGTRKARLPDAEVIHGRTRGPFLRSEPVADTFDSHQPTLTMGRLHLDAKLSIAHTSIATWNALMRADPIFGRYALSDTGRSDFLSAFTVVENGKWRVGCQLHRIGGPARVCISGTEVWYIHGKLHRIGGPARTWSYGAEEWFEHGELHRIDGPARTWRFSSAEEWYYRGQLHRIGGPARIWHDGTEEWFEHGVCAN